MRLARNKTFDLALKTKLEAAGLPFNPSEVVGRLYRFGCEHGSHYHILSGRIQAIEVSEMGDLILYVTNPRFRSGRLISFKQRGNGEWTAYVDWRNDANKSFIDGELELL